MLRWLLRRRVAAFERRWDCEAGELRDLIDADAEAAAAFGMAQAIGRYRKDAPAAVRCAAGLIAVMAEDCEPSAQLAVARAERDGVDPAVLRAVVARDYLAMPEDVVLAARFAEATLRHAPEVDDLRDELERKFGRRGLVSIVFAIVSARIDPTLKYALGRGKACARLTVGGQTQAPGRESRPSLRELAAG